MAEVLAIPAMQQQDMDEISQDETDPRPKWRKTATVACKYMHAQQLVLHILVLQRTSESQFLL